MIFWWEFQRAAWGMDERFEHATHAIEWMCMCLHMLFESCTHVAWIRFSCSLFRSSNWSLLVNSEKFGGVGAAGPRRRGIFFRGVSPAKSTLRVGLKPYFELCQGGASGSPNSLSNQPHAQPSELNVKSWGWRESKSHPCLSSMSYDNPPDA